MCHTHTRTIRKGYISSYLLTNVPVHIFSKERKKKVVDDAEKSIISYTILTCSKQHLYNTKREDLIESIGVVLIKYPPKVKLELLTTLECQSRVNYAYFG